MASQPYIGLVAAVHTPFVNVQGVGGAVALGVVDSQAALMHRLGVAAVFVAGTTGEGASLTLAERRALFEAWAEAGPRHGLRVIAHVGGNCVQDAVELARGVEALAGIEAIAAIAPSFLAPPTADALARTMAIITDAAPSKPAYYYDIPDLTGIGFPAAELCRAFGQRVPDLRGIKCTRYTPGDVMEFARAHDGAYDVLFGRDESLLSVLPLGIRGAVGSSYNYAAPLYLELMRAYERGDVAGARALQQHSVDMITDIAAVGYLPACRAIMEHLGVAMGPPRLPLVGLDGQGRSRALAALDGVPIVFESGASA